MSSSTLRRRFVGAGRATRRTPGTPSRRCAASTLGSRRPGSTTSGRRWRRLRATPPRRWGWWPRGCGCRRSPAGGRSCGSVVGCSLGCSSVGVCMWLLGCCRAGCCTRLSPAAPLAAAAATTTAAARRVLEQMQADLQAGRFAYRPSWAQDGGSRTGHSSASTYAAFLTPGGAPPERRGLATPTLVSGGVRGRGRGGWELRGHSGGRGWRLGVLGNCGGPTVAAPLLFVQPAGHYRRHRADGDVHSGHRADQRRQQGSRGPEGVPGAWCCPRERGRPPCWQPRAGGRGRQCCAHWPSASSRQPAPAAATCCRVDRPAQPDKLHAAQQLHRHHSWQRRQHGAHPHARACRGRQQWQRQRQ